MMSSSDETARPPTLTAADLFEALWTGLGEMLGPTATAVLLRRSLKRVNERRPAMCDVEITRDQFEYGYKVPTSWGTDDAEAIATFHDIIRELWPLLQQLTGPVVVRRLQDVPLLAQRNALPKDLQQ